MGVYIRTQPHFFPIGRIRTRIPFSAQLVSLFRRLIRRIGDAVSFENSNTRPDSALRLIYRLICRTNECPVDILRTEIFATEGINAKETFNFIEPSLDVFSGE